MNATTIRHDDEPPEVPKNGPGSAQDDEPTDASLKEYVGPITVIRPQEGWVSIEFVELWRYRDLLVQKVYRDFSAKYRQSFIGVGWAFVNPLMCMVVFTIVFSKIAKLPSEGVPYPVFNFSGLIPWLYFSGCLTRASQSTISGGQLLTKVYFPRLLLPLSKVINGLIDFGIQLVLLLGLMMWFGVTPSGNMILIPVFLAVCMTTALSVSLWATALVVKYRDVQSIIGYVMQMWMWLTPVAYSASSVPEEWQAVYALNPMVGVLEGFRWAILGNAAPNWEMMAVSTFASILMLISGLYFFRRVESTFADVI